MSEKHEPFYITCDWCGKVKKVAPSDAKGKTFQSCSVECKWQLQKVYMKNKWASLTPEKREEWLSNITNSHTNDGQGFIDYYKKSRPERVKKVIELMSTPVEKKLPNQRFMSRRDKKIRRKAYEGCLVKSNPRIDSEEWLPRGTCTLIAAHHEMLKHDPERLTTAFMEKICGVDCKCKVKKEEQV